MTSNVQIVRKQVKTKRAHKAVNSRRMANGTPGKRLAALRADAGYPTPADFARAVGVNYRTYLAHESDRGLIRNAHRYAQFLGVPVDAIVSEGTQPGTKRDRLPQPFLALRPIVVLTVAELNSIISIGDMLKLKSNKTAAIPKSETIGPKARGFEIPDDAMTDIGRRYETSLHQGDIVIFDPDKTSLVGKLVVARLFNPDRTVCRMYAKGPVSVGTPVIRLIAFNPYHSEETIRSPQDGVILGVAVKRIGDI